MKKSKQLGVWMDHSNAILMELADGNIIQSSITSTFTHEVRELSLTKSENLMHNKEKHQLSEYYGKISDLIRNYNEVVVFGPTEAKSELHNILKVNHLFKDIAIVIKDSGKMNEYDMRHFVIEHFKQ